MEDIIKVEGVAKAYGKHQVHKGLDLGIKKGECFTLLGPSGCGKTVLIRLIAGHEVPDEGRIIIDNTVVADSASGEYIPPERRGLGIVFQDYAVWPHMTVYDNIAYPLKMEKRPKEEIDKLVMKMIDIVGMKGLDKRLPSELSGGQQQRVALRAHWLRTLRLCFWMSRFPTLTLTCVRKCALRLRLCSASSA